jgi:hypothetical protein
MKRLSVLLLGSLLVLAYSDTLDLQDWSIRLTSLEKSGEEPVNDLANRGLGVLRSSYFDDLQTVADYLLFNPKVSRRLERLHPQATKAETKYLSDGTVATQYEIQLTGAILQTIMPKTGGGIPVGPMACPTCGQPWPEGHEVPSGVTLMPLEEANGPAYTGVLFDARGVDFNPALFPRIVNEDARVVYGPEFFIATYAAARGPVGYYSSISAAQTDDRVGYNPLRINAIRPAGKNNTDLVITNSDARRLHSSLSNLKLLERCRVVIVAD